MASRNSFVLSPVAVLVLLLIALAAFVVYLKVTYLHMPLQPDEESDIWTVEARIDFTGRGGSSRVNFRLPEQVPGFTRIDENFVSRSFGLTVIEEPREAVWTLRRTDGPQALFYRVQIYPENPQAAEAAGVQEPDYPEAPDYPEPLASAIDDVLSRARSESADIFTFANRLLTILADTDDENVKVIRSSRPAAEWVPLLTEILAGARIPSRVVYGVSLRADFIEQPLIAWMEVNNGTRWRGFNPETGAMGYPENFFPWATGLQTIVQSQSNTVRNLELTFSASRTSIAQEELALQVENTLLTGLTNFTLYSLPIPAQEVYRVLLMVPIGALVIAFMRVVVGIPTFGTFTPILIALAFRETQLGWGVTLFLFILLAGFLVRTALASLRLLLVPRLACMLIVVIGLMVIMSLFSARIGFTQGLSIALFPMVILTMTIERMSIVWEERGSVETIKETVGSLLVAVSGYYVMNNPLLMHLMFNFPELLLVVLAVCMMFGSYTGYRLSEVLRFKDLAEEKVGKEEKG